MSGIIRSSRIKSGRSRLRQGDGFGPSVRPHHGVFGYGQEGGDDFDGLRVVVDHQDGAGHELGRLEPEPHEEALSCARLIGFCSTAAAPLASAMLRVDQTGNDDDRDVGQSIDLADAKQELPAVDAGQFQVDGDQAERLLGSPWQEHPRRWRHEGP